MVALVVIGLIGIAAWTAPQPTRTDVPSPVVTTTAPEPASAAKFSSCPWAVASSFEETYFGLEALSPADVMLTFPFAGEIRDVVEEALPGPAATSVRLGQHLSQGLAPVVVEYSSEPAGAVALVTGEVGLAGTVCPSSTPKVWHFPGGSTFPGEELQLQLFNPFPEDASITVGAHSEFGSEPDTGLEVVSIQSRSWKVIDLHTILPGREQLGLLIEVTQGNIIPALSLTTELGTQALWSGVGQGDVWAFPIGQTDDLEPTLFVSNDGGLDVAYEIDLMTTDETAFGVRSGTVGPLSQARVPLGGLVEGPFGVTVTTDGPVAAAVVARSELGVATEPGAPLTSNEWLLPGVGAVTGATYRIWLLNPGSSSLTVSLTPMDTGGFTDAPDKISVPPGTIRAVPVDVFRVFGYVAEAPRPFVAAWSATTAADIAYVGAIPVVRESNP